MEAWIRASCLPEAAADDDPMWLAEKQVGAHGAQLPLPLLSFLLALGAPSTSAGRTASTPNTFVTVVVT
jgi:hypothetical protein